MIDLGRGAECQTFINRDVKGYSHNILTRKSFASVRIHTVAVASFVDNSLLLCYDKIVERVTEF